MQLRNLFLAALCIGISATATAQTTEKHDGYVLIKQDGPTIGYSPKSGVKLIRKGKLVFKDLNRNGKLDPYEDWRLDIEERVKDLAAQLSEEEIAGLMLYSNHQAIPTTLGYHESTYNGKPYAESGAKPWNLSDNQKTFLREDNLRHVLITAIESAEVAARWNNEAQAFVEGLGHGIPNNNSSDPRNTARSDSEFNAGGGGEISMWPSELGMGATFDPELVRSYGKIAAAEYRALGMTTALSPQIDIATDPRWFRFSGTYGEDPQLNADIAEAYCDGFQTSYGAAAMYGAWGLNSVNAMAKHWPGGGSGEGGRDAHYGRGKFAVYPNNNIELHKKPFLEGAFKLKNGTGKAAAVMPYYTISYGQSSQNLANNFNSDIIGRQLRQDADYDGVVCTDWAVTADIIHPGVHSGKPYGVESMTLAERHKMVLMAGGDQFGGNNDKRPVLEAFRLMEKEMGKKAMQERIRLSARRLLRNIFRVGLFENPYLDPAESSNIVGNADFMAKGYEAQLKSIVMVKNHAATLPLKQGKTRVYIPQRHVPAHMSFWGGVEAEQTITPINMEMASRYFSIASQPSEADAALIFIDSPNSGYGHSLKDAMRDPETKQHVLKELSEEWGRPVPDNYAETLIENFFIPEGGEVSEPDNAYYPISLQYNDYVATTARAQSIAGGDPNEKISNRSYRGKGVRTINNTDLQLVEKMRREMPGKKIIVVLNSANPTVLGEIEPLADAILVTFDIQKQAVLDIVSGKYEPSGLLPFQMPADMLTVEAQAEDTPHDMQCYTDCDGNTYDFAYGLNWDGTIFDERVLRYRHATSDTNLSITPLADNAVRVQYGKPTLPELTYLGEKQDIQLNVSEDSECTRYELPKMSVTVSKKDGKVRFYDADGKCVLTETAHSLTPSTVQDLPTYISTATFDSPANEHIYGLGQFQDGYLDVRGLPRRLTQVNTQISIPMITSSNGYSLLWNNYGLTDFNPCQHSVKLTKSSEQGNRSEVNVTGTEGNRKEVREDGTFALPAFEVEEDGYYALLLDVGQSMARTHHLAIDGKDVINQKNLWLPPTTSCIVYLTKGVHSITAKLEKNDAPTLYYNKVEPTTTFSSPVSEAVDYTVFVGNADEAISAYRQLSGNTPMPPMWAMGYVHCRERFHSTDEILSTAQTFREKQLPMDVMVQDWQWWGKHGWNSFQFDEENYPDPKLLVDSLHSMGSRLMLSVWSKIDENCAVGREAKQLGFYIPGTSWIDFFNPKASRYYWQNFTTKLLKPYGIDCWWQDATEPENDDLVGRRIYGDIPGEVLRNVYPNFVSKTVYEGSRMDAPDHRTLILTRSGAPGIQRYGSFLWSGDVGNDWQTLRYQLASGLSLMAAGHPWWTYDAGGFFRPWGNQYEDKQFHERFMRWLQIATFLPMMRVHGYMTDTEFWRYGEEVERLSRQQLELRYRMLPYNYSLCHEVTKGYTMLRPLVMDFAHDEKALSLKNEYMFGPSLLVAPVMEPEVTSQSVYLPETAGGWYNLHTQQKVEANGSNLNAPVTLENIPVYVRAGAILPEALPMQTTASYSAEKTVLNIYPGADGSFTLYEDEGVNYNYEQGKYSTIDLKWNDATRTLTIGERSGSYEGMPEKRTFIVRVVGSKDKLVKYNGKAQKVKR